MGLGSSKPEQEKKQPPMPTEQPVVNSSIEDQLPVSTLLTPKSRKLESVKTANSRQSKPQFARPLPSSEAPNKALLTPPPPVSEQIKSRTQSQATRRESLGPQVQTERFQQNHSSEAKPMSPAKSGLSRDIPESRIVDEPVTRVDYLFLVEQVRTLSESIRQLNSKVYLLEADRALNKTLQTSTSPQGPIEPLRELKSENQRSDQAENSKPDPEDLIRKMKEQLRKRKPEVATSLEESRDIYKKVKNGFLGSEAESASKQSERQS